MAVTEQAVEEKFEVRVDSVPPRMAFVMIPIGKYLEDNENGMKLLYGALREAEAHLARMFVTEKKKRQTITPGVIGPDGKPLVVH